MGKGRDGNRVTPFERGDEVSAGEGDASSNSLEEEARGRSTTRRHAPVSRFHTFSFRSLVTPNADVRDGEVAKARTWDGEEVGDDALEEKEGSRDLTNDEPTRSSICCSTPVCSRSQH